MLGRSASMRQALHVAFVRGIAGADPVPRFERFEQREATGLDELLRARSAGFSRALCKTFAYHCSRARWSLRAISSLWHSSPCVECHTHFACPVAACCNGRCDTHSLGNENACRRLALPSARCTHRPSPHGPFHTPTGMQPTSRIVSASSTIATALDSTDNIIHTVGARKECSRENLRRVLCTRI